MPCGAQVEVVQVTVQHETDVEVTDHADLEIRVLPILPPHQTHTIVREELVARGWQEQPDGSLTKQVGEATATLPAGSSTIRIELSGERSVSASASTNQTITAGDEQARAAVQARVEADAARRLEAAADRARQELEQAGAPVLLEVWRQLREELDEAVNATTRRALEQRATELGSIESIAEAHGDDGYELTITVRT
jgi:hypothetical protein